MQIININDKEQLNKFIGMQKHSQFLQSWQWGEFQKNVSGNVVRLAVEDGGNLIAAGTLIKKILPMGKNYFYCPRGPMIKCEIDESGCKEAVGLLLSEAENIGAREGAMFLRFDPLFNVDYLGGKVAKTLDIEPSQTQILKLDKTESEILKNMRQKTRYNINLAEKHGVKIIEADAGRFEDFWQLMCETSERDNFRTHGINYYKEMLQIDGDFIKLFIAEYKNTAIGAIIVSFFGDTATYMHGASSDQHRNVMAPYLLQWHCIKLAKKSGCTYYDFYGIDEKKWPGITKFKQGFGGRAVNYLGTYDYIFDPNWYNVYKMIRKVRRTF